MPRIVKLVNVQGDVNKNKFYTMSENGDGTWTAHWGRVGGEGEKQIYPMTEWAKKYREKITKKGYKDITDLVSVAMQNDKGQDVAHTELFGSASAKVREIMNFLKSCAQSAISENYTVKVADVTEKQIEAAQAILDVLVTKTIRDREQINEMLLEIFRILPRRMVKTQNYLLQPGQTLSDYQKLISNEQSLLDVMRGQVVTPSVVKTSSTGKETLPLEVREANAAEIQEIKAQTDFDLSKAKAVLRVINTNTQKAYDGVTKQNEKLLYHGSKTINWWNITNQGLKIRPVNAIHTGSMFGDAIYGADVAKKSIGYTDGGFWTSSKGSNRRFLGIYTFNLGRTWNLLEKQRYSSWMSSLTQKKVNSEGYDSAFAKGGYDLRHNEYMIYQEPRCTIKYLIELL